MRVLFLDIDTLRPDHLGCYGYHRDTSPNIDEIAGQGVRFSHYHCSDAPCMPSRAALMSGRYGIHTGVVGHGGTCGDMWLQGSSRGFRDRMANEGMGAMLKRAGLKPVTISPFAERHGAWWFLAAFTEYYNTGKGGMESAEDITPTALRWIEQNAKEDNWFLHVNYWDPHTPYRAPEAFGDPFADDPLPAWLTPEVLEQHRQMAGPHGAREINMYDNVTNPRYPRHPGELCDMKDVRRMIDGYDCGVRYVDGHIGMLFEALAKQGVMDDLTIIISADHGENLGELGIWGEHATADEITTHIPLIIRWPDAKKAHVDTGLHLNIDLMPTLAELLGVSMPNRWDGQSFAPAISNGAEASRDHIVVSQCVHVCQRSARFDDWLYTRTIHDGFHLFPEDMLYKLDTDPHEQGNVAEHFPEVCERGSKLILDWQEAQMATSDYDIDPMWKVMREGGPHHARGQLKRYCDWLEKTERGWASEALRKRHPEEFA